MQVKLQPGESGEYLVKRFMRKWKKSDVMKTLLERRTYKKPSEVKRLAEAKRQMVLRGLQAERDGLVDQKK